MEAQTKGLGVSLVEKMNVLDSSDHSTIVDNDQWDFLLEFKFQSMEL